MTFKELAEDFLKDNPEGIWVHFVDCWEYPDEYLDEYYMTEFAGCLDKEVEDFFINDCDVMEVFLKRT